MSGLAAAELARVAVPLGAVGLVAIGASGALAELLRRVSGTGEWQTWRRRLAASGCP